MTSGTKSSPRAAVITLSAALDVICVLLFIAIGRSSHAREASLLGLWDTAWPFLAALTIMWALALIWKSPLSLWRAGLPVWLGTVVIGLLLRVLCTASGAALAFVLVTFFTLGLLLMGWRIIALLIVKLRSTRERSAQKGLAYPTE